MFGASEALRECDGSCWRRSSEKRAKQSEEDEDAIFIWRKKTAESREKDHNFALVRSEKRAIIPSTRLEPEENLHTIQLLEHVLLARPLMWGDKSEISCQNLSPSSLRFSTSHLTSLQFFFYIKPETISGNIMWFFSIIYCFSSELSSAWWCDRTCAALAKKRPMKCL